MKRLNAAYIALFILINSVVLVALLEIFARLFDPLGVSYYPDTAKLLDTMVLEEPIGYKNGPNLSLDLYGTRINTNSLGLRHDALELQGEDSKYRILFLGDSVVFGVGVNDEDTLAVQLEERLSKHKSRSVEKSIEVMNMGTISYNTEQELIQYKSVGALLKPNLVLLMFSSNDIEPKMWVFDRRKNPLVRLAQRSYGVSLLYLIKQRIQSRFAKQERNGLIQWAAYTEENPRWLSIRNSLLELKALLDSENIPFILLGQGRENRAWNMVRQFAEDEEIEARLVNPFDDPRWQSLDPNAFLAPKGGGHLNKEGLHMYSIIIQEMLEELGYVTDDPKLSDGHEK